jgi:hypothetical protein
MSFSFREMRVAFRKMCIANQEMRFACCGIRFFSMRCVLFGAKCILLIADRAGRDGLFGSVGIAVQMHLKQIRTSPFATPKKQLS